ncbi:transposase [Kitasatospora albolonga]|uniref:transposase n=1 Tax=Kitasatospora albolonga TaxID=68173 RepID=UPI001FC9675C
MFFDESGVSLLPQIRRTYAPRDRTPLLRHCLNWKRASMAGASSLKKRDLAGDHLADVADATEQGIHCIDTKPQLPWSFLTHTGLTIPHHPPNSRKDQ